MIVYRTHTPAPAGVLFYSASRRSCDIAKCIQYRVHVFFLLMITIRNLIYTVRGGLKTQPHIDIMAAVFLCLKEEGVRILKYPVVVVSRMERK